MALKVSQFIYPEHPNNGQFFIPTSNPLHYLHNDGVIRKGTYNQEKYEFTGWFLTREEAQQVLEDYNAQQQTNIHNTPTDR